YLALTVVRSLPGLGTRDRLLDREEGAVAHRAVVVLRNGAEALQGARRQPERELPVAFLGALGHANHMLRRFHEDLERVGLRARRQHDSRRTFISIARADGARPDILRWVTHGPTGDIVDDYTTLPPLGDLLRAGR